MEFIAVIVKKRKCVECGEEGFHNRMDCGCMWDEEVGRYPTRSAARLAAMARSRKKGTFGIPSGRASGHWTIETEQDGIIEASK